MGAEVPGPKLANLLEQGDTPLLSPERLHDLGFKLVAYPLTLMSAAIRAMKDALEALAAGRVPDGLTSFADIRELVGFSTYDEEVQRYSTSE